MRFKDKIITALLMLMLSAALTACSHHAPFTPQYNEIEGNYELHGIGLKNKTLYSYTSINGDKRAKASEYIIFGQDGPLSFYSLPDDGSEAKAFLESPCCGDGMSTHDKIIQAKQWIEAQFPDSQPVTMEIVFVPFGYKYQYATRYKIEDGIAKVRFAFHYNNTEKEVLAAKMIDTLVHELTHVHFKFHPEPPKNEISDETLAALMGVCSNTFTRKTIPNPAVSILPADDVMEQIRGWDHETKMRRLVDNSHFLISKILVQITVEKMYEKHGHTHGRVEAEMIKYCESVLANNHDFTQSLGLE